MSVLHFAIHIQYACLNCHANIDFVFPINNVDLKS